VILAIALAGCSATTSSTKTGAETAKVDPKLGVKPSPRVVGMGDKVPKGGGKAMVGKPYKVAGKRYVPRLDPDYEAVGLASWYGNAFHGRKTANGEVFDSEHLSAAHPTMPLPSYARVTSVVTGRSVVVRVNDRGPFHSNRLIDISRRTADVIGVRAAGIAKVKVEYIGPAPTEGDDTEFLMASYRGPADVPAPLGETMIASAEALPGVAARATLSAAGAAASAATGLLPGFGDDDDAMPAAAPKAPEAPVMVADASEPAPVGPPVAGDVLPPQRPGIVVEAYVTVASIDPADAFLGAGTQVAQAEIAAVAPVAFTPASFEVGAQPAVFEGAPLPPEPPVRRSYAEDRIAVAYAAVEAIDNGVGLGDLARRLEGIPGARPASGGPTVQVGVFADPANAARIARDLEGVGSVSVDLIVVNGRTLSQVRLSALNVPGDTAVAAAERAGAHGARLLR
jgi:rare lipoprotein A